MGCLWGAYRGAYRGAYKGIIWPPIGGGFDSTFSKGGRGRVWLHLF